MRPTALGSRTAMLVSSSSNPVRTVATSPTRASSSRRNANMSARRLGASIHWRSSTATIVGVGPDDSTRSAPRVASARAVGSTVETLALRRSACSSDTCWIAGSSASTRSSTRAKRSVRTANGRSTSASDGRAVKTE